MIIPLQEVACGLDHSAVIDAYDRLWTMGSNKCGQRGLGHYKPFSHPTIVKASLSGKKIASVSAGWQLRCLIIQCTVICT